ncbi:hypothetical protein [Paenibacillus sp. GYB003]|uniref:hypothetical protein n=1 Tax=Paenibacillus sp. GYB003 TaxID=2994392 RepID=UPI002F965BFB
MITLRPDLKTAGGEVTELLLDGRFVGAMTLVYREGDRLSGSVQLERDSLEGGKKAEAIQAAQQYIEHLVDALGARDCEVIVTCSSYDHIMTAGHQIGVIESFADELADTSEDDDESHLDDVDPDGRDSIEMAEDDEDRSPVHELAIVGESRNRIEYHMYGPDREWLAEAFVRIRGADVLAEIDWKFEPADADIEAATRLLVSDFDPDEVDTFHIEMKYDGDTIETVDLTHEDFLDDDEYDVASVDDDHRGYSVVLARNDGDTITYDLYKKSHGGLPIARATVDVSRRELSGFIDFRDPESSEDREYIGALLMQELDKEKDYDSLNLSMLVNNRLIDDIVYETEIVH